MIKEFQIEIPITYLHTNLVITGLFSLCGDPLIDESSGGSVERAIAAKESIIRLIQSSQTADIGDYPIKIAPNKTEIMAEMLTVTQNCKNLLTLI